MFSHFHHIRSRRASSSSMERTASSSCSSNAKPQNPISQTVPQEQGWTQSHQQEQQKEQKQQQQQLARLPIIDMTGSSCNKRYKSTGGSSGEASYDDPSAPALTTTNTTTTTTTTTATSSNDSSSKQCSDPHKNAHRKRPFAQLHSSHDSLLLESSFAHLNHDSKEKEKVLGLGLGPVHTNSPQVHTIPARKWTTRSKSKHWVAADPNRKLDDKSQAHKILLQKCSLKTCSSITLSEAAAAPTEEDGIQETNHEYTTASGNASDHGYSASASSNDLFCIGQQSSCSSPSMSSSEEEHHHHHHHSKGRRFEQLHPTMDIRQRSESSSEIADFSSTHSEPRSSSPSSSSSSCSSSRQDDQPLVEFDLVQKQHTMVMNPAPVNSSSSCRRVKARRMRRLHLETMQGTQKQDFSQPTALHSNNASVNGIVSYSLDSPSKILVSNHKMTMNPLSSSSSSSLLYRRQWPMEFIQKHSQKAMTCTRTPLDSNTPLKPPSRILKNESLIYSVGVDVMSTILSFLDPMESHRFLSMPLSKTFRAIYTQPQDLWKILCLSEPFMVKMNHREEVSTTTTTTTTSNSGDESSGSFPMCNSLGVRHSLGKYRLLYTSFIRCVRYLDRIKEDAVHGRLPLGVDEVMDETDEAVGNSASLVEFFAQAREFSHEEDRHDMHFDSSSDSDSDSVQGNNNNAMKTPGIFQSVEVSDDKEMIVRKEKSKINYGHSTLTDRLLGPSKQSGIAGPVELPWSCAIYSVVNWLVAFADVEGIQIMSLKVLPYLLEDENQRTIAQRTGLTDIVLRAMIRFPSSVALHTASFHTLVLLARPLGGREGMLFHVAMLNTSGVLCSKSGIAVMLDSMKRFADDEVLQAMACWSLVNIALIPAQKKVLVSLGGIATAANAMMKHPLNPDVQFRALFALINLVIPSNSLPDNSIENSLTRTQMAVDTDEQSERELLDESATKIASLVVMAMRNFCSSEAILNRACLVLHNLSLNEGYHRTLLFTPHCYQMLEWCIANYRNDSVLQQSAGGTLQRLQLSLASDDILRTHFVETLRSQHILSDEPNTSTP